MSIWTEEELLRHIGLYKSALEDLAIAEQTTFEGITLRRSQLPEVRKQLQYYEGELERLRGGHGIHVVNFGSVR